MVWVGQGSSRSFAGWTLLCGLARLFFFLEIFLFLADGVYFHPGLGGGGVGVGLSW